MPARNVAAEEALRQAQAVKDLIANLEYERTLIGKSEVEQAKMNALRQAGTAATDDQRKMIAQLVEASAAEKAMVEATTQSVQLSRDMLSGSLTDVRTAFEDGKVTIREWGSVFLNVVNKAVDALQTQLVNAAITPSGFNLFGTLFGAGTVVAGGGTIGGGASGGAAAAAVQKSSLAAAKSAQPAVSKIEIDMKADGKWQAHVSGAARNEAKRVVSEDTPTMVKAGVNKFRKDVLPGDVKSIGKNPRYTRLKRPL